MLSLGACREPAKNPRNLLPYGYVDTPKAGDVLRPGKTLVGGWALDDTGVAEVRVFFDGRYKASAPIAAARPDVGKVMPQCARQRNICGWNLLVDFGLVAGEHTILVQAIDDMGASRDIGTIPVTIPR
jgi:hypothetical protein